MIVGVAQKRGRREACENFAIGVLANQRVTSELVCVTKLDAGVMGREADVRG